MATSKMPGARAWPVYEAAFGPRLGQHFGLSAVPFLATPEDAPHFAVTRLCATGHAGPGPWLRAEPACLIFLQLMPARLEIRRAGWDAERHQCGAGSIGVESLDSALSLSFRGPFDCLSFYIQRGFFDNAVYPPDRAAKPGCHHGTRDDVVPAFGDALLPLLASPERASPVFLDHIARALCLHLVYAYGGRGSFQPQ